MEEPANPSDLSLRAWWGVFRRTVREFRDDNLTDWAAALTYYGILSIFPALIALVAILGLAGASATQSVLDNLNELAPGPANDIVQGAIKEIGASQGSAGVALIVGLAAAIWSASAYVGAFTRASNLIYEVEEGRPFWKLRPVQIVITAVLILLLAVSAIAVVVTGPLAEQVAKAFGLQSTAATVWDIAKWPAIILVVVSAVAVLYWAAPNVRHPGFRWITPGGLVAVVLWMLASGAFALYVANFDSYNKTYGSLGGVIVFLVWLWISNLAVLLGAEFNAELERGRELASGVRPEQTIAIETRDQPRHA